MPTYQYQCADCGEALEVRQGFDDDALTECPACGGRLRKVFGAVGVVFKGSGFYKTDSRGKPSPSESASTSKDGSSSTTTKEPSTPKQESTNSTSKPVEKAKRD